MRIHDDRYSTCYQSTKMIKVTVRLWIRREREETESRILREDGGNIPLLVTKKNGHFPFSRYFS
jgi:hypothetical protein